MITFLRNLACPIFWYSPLSQWLGELDRDLLFVHCRYALAFSWITIHPFTSLLISPTKKWLNLSICYHGRGGNLILISSFSSYFICIPLSIFVYSIIASPEGIACLLEWISSKKKSWSKSTRRRHQIGSKNDPLNGLAGDEVLHTRTIKSYIIFPSLFWPWCAEGLRWRLCSNISGRSCDIARQEPRDPLLLLGVIRPQPPCSKLIWARRITTGSRAFHPSSTHYVHSLSTTWVWEAITALFLFPCDLFSSFFQRHISSHP